MNKFLKQWEIKHNNICIMEDSEGKERGRKNI